MKQPGHRLAAGLVSASLLGLAGAPAAHGQAPAPTPAPGTATQPAAPATPAIPVDPTKPLVLEDPPKPADPTKPLVLEDPPKPADPTKPLVLEDPAQPKAKAQAPQPARPAKRSRAKQSKDSQPAAANGAASAQQPSAAVLNAIPNLPPADVPSYFIDSFRVPVFLLPIYQAAGIQYGVRWEVLAAINEIETDYGRNLSVSTAGAMGWMQFMPATWLSYGVDGNGDGRADPYNPVDAIFAAARYLQAAGAGQDLRKAIFSYNHADWYVNSVLQRAQGLAALPTDLVGALTGLAQGRSPVLGKTSPVASAQAQSRSLQLRVKDQAPVVAVADGTVVRVGRTPRLGPFVQLRDVYGNTYTYGNLGGFAKQYPVLKGDGTVVAPAALPPEQDAAPTMPATAGAHPRAAPAPASSQPAATAPAAAQPAGTAPAAARPTATAPAPARPATSAPTAAQPAASAPSAAAPATPASPTASAPQQGTAPAAPAAKPTTGRDDAGLGSGTPDQITTAAQATPAGPLAAIDWGVQALRRGIVGPPAAAAAPRPRKLVASAYDRELLGGVSAKRLAYRPLREGSHVVAGTILGHAGSATTDAASATTVPARVRFEVRPAGPTAPRVDPRPIVAGWKLLQTSDRGAPALGPAPQASIGEVLLLGRQALQRLVLDNPRIAIYPCGREDIAAGRIDRRVLATLQVLAMSGLSPTVSALQCGHSRLTTSGNVSEHSSGNAVDIAAINNIPILGHQGAGSITDTTIRRLLTLQGTMRPHQIISLMTFDGASNTLSLPDHADHIHVGFSPLGAPGSLAARLFNGVLQPKAWRRLIDRLAAIDNPRVASTPSAVAVPTAPAKPSKPAKP